MALFFAVHKITMKDGSVEFQMDWHPDLYPVLEAISPNGEFTDKIIDIAHELDTAEVGDEDEDE